MNRARKLAAAQCLAAQGATPGEREAARLAVERLRRPTDHEPRRAPEQGWRVLSRLGTHRVVAVSPRDVRLILARERARRLWVCTSCDAPHLANSHTWRPAVRTRLAVDDGDVRLCDLCVSSGEGRLLGA